MDRDDGARALGHGRPHGRGIEAPGQRVDIRKDRDGGEVEGRRGGGDPGDGRHDNLVAGTNAGRAQRYLERDRPIHRRDAVPSVVGGGEAGRELVSLIAGLGQVVAAPAATLDHVDYRLDLALIVDRPGGERGGPHGRSTIDRENRHWRLLEMRG